MLMRYCACVAWAISSSQGRKIAEAWRCEYAKTPIFCPGKSKVHWMYLQHVRTQGSQGQQFVQSFAVLICTCCFVSGKPPGHPSKKILSNHHRPMKVNHNGQTSPLAESHLLHISNFRYTGIFKLLQKQPITIPSQVWRCQRLFPKHIASTTDYNHTFENVQVNTYIYLNIYKHVSTYMCTPFRYHWAALCAEENQGKGELNQQPRHHWYPMP